ncbi:cation transporter [Protaetiibacter mangrovi]|uniref:Cation transporter n=1 Tax=Protaetiibacter mangrovi TaxID=2970926 RepID=A0ABT1ZG47_9MICO|nr:cation transporter [Protaetiibacter mangrovi]MCS0499693.1 cation transporter [Protaetiibacter mangrovi]
MTFRRTVLVVALLNLGFFAVDFVVALTIGSVSLFADSVDFLEDASINLLIFAASAWSMRRQSHVGSVLAFVILVPAVATIIAAVQKILNPVAPEIVPLSLTAAGALAINLTCALLLVRHRNLTGSMARAAWLSARNDALANVAIIAGAVATLWVHTGWVDIAIGIAIGLLNADAARAVWRAARDERLGRRSARP